MIKSLEELKEKHYDHMANRANFMQPAQLGELYTKMKAKVLGLEAMPKLKQERLVY